MFRRRIHQYHETVSERDAIGENILALQRMFLESGYESSIFYDRCSDSLRNQGHSFERYKEFSSPENILLIHYSIGNPKLNHIAKLPDKKILLYHNITPAKYFRDVCKQTERSCDEGRNALPAIAKNIDHCIGVSKFNCSELEQAGFRNVSHIPLLVDFKKYKTPPNPELAFKLKSDQVTTWVFVGRVVPHKKQEDVLKVFYYYQKYMNQKSRLFLIGNAEGMFFYRKYLERLIVHLRVKNVVITGSVSQEDLMAYYQAADLFICMSEHEGFCIPLLEAMISQIPILAYDSSAIRETLDSCGLLVKEKNFPLTGELAHYLLENHNMKQRMIRKQQNRLQAFASDLIKNRWQDILTQIMGY